ncbi:MAG: NAD(P)H-dependent oxidoreductase subunit E [Planctomycetes bacterium]|nr:NAD(P)H-dependent oxidoreductase subunit E [Planctomycetota bacterium]
MGNENKAAGDPIDVAITVSATSGDPAATDKACASDTDVQCKKERLAKVDEIIERIGKKREHILPILQDIQDEFRYLPADLLEHVSNVTEIHPGDIAGVSTFYSAFRHTPMGTHSIRVCTGTACHVQGAGALKENLFYIHDIDFKNGHDTDADMQVTVEEVACLGCCTLAPVVQVDSAVVGPIAIEQAPSLLIDIDESAAKSYKDFADQSILRPEDAIGEIRISLDSCCIARGADKIFEATKEAVRKQRLPVIVKSVGCWGMSCKAPMVEIIRNDQPPLVYGEVLPEDSYSLVEKHFPSRNVIKRLTSKVSNAIDDMLRHDERTDIAEKQLRVSDPSRVSFMGSQVRIATEHYGQMDPLNIQEYMARDGFKALETVVKEWDQDQLINCVLDSGLRGRGGGGFPTGRKWSFVKEAKGEPKYVICNGDEGDPGAFMDRMMLESFPFRVIEGLAIAARAAGSTEAIFYIRAEYPLAVERINIAIKICEEEGIIGKDGMIPLNMRVIKGGGAFVCGEETAMLNSIEGGRGTPRTRPPFPAHEGLWGKPTLVNNVETLAMLSWIIRNGPEAFNQYGTETSKGTKVFALAGKVRYGGLVEVPMGITIREIVEEVGGGCPDGKKFKAVLIGGPSGGCIPASLADTPIDYEALKALGAIMGSGGLVVLDEDDCVIDMARYFMAFAQDECCGQCSIGRIGTKRLLDIMDRMVSGKGKKADMKALQSLGPVVKNGSLCGLCQTAPNPILTTMEYFPEEYQAHLKGDCPTGTCSDLTHYIIQDNCIGCTRCSVNCPVDAIPLDPYEVHHIIDDLCTRCDTCFQVCPENAIVIR